MNVRSKPAPREEYIEVEAELPSLWEAAKGELTSDACRMLRTDVLTWLELPTGTPIDSVVLSAVALFFRPSLSRFHEELHNRIKQKLKVQDQLELLARVCNAPFSAWEYIVHVGIGVDTLLSTFPPKHPLGAEGLYIFEKGVVRRPEIECCRSYNASPPEVPSNGSIGKYIGWNIGPLLAFNQLGGTECKYLAMAASQDNASQNDESQRRIALQILIAPWSIDS